MFKALVLDKDAQGSFTAAVLPAMTTEIGLAEAIDSAARLMAGAVRGRIVVRTTA